MIIYTIKDELTTYKQPFTAYNEDEAMRNFAQLANDPDTWVGQSPEDYSLYKLGDYDIDTGEIKPELKKIIGARSLIKAKNEQ